MGKTRVHIQACECSAKTVPGSPLPYVIYIYVYTVPGEPDVGKILVIFLAPKVKQISQIFGHF